MGASGRDCIVDLYERLLMPRPDGVLLGLPDGTVLRANAAACRMLGRAEDEIRREGRASVVATDPDVVRDLAERRVRDGAVAGDLLLRRADGTVFPAEFDSTTTTFEDGAAFTITTFRDVSERRRIEADLQESEERLRLFVEHAPAAIAMFDRDMRYLAASRRWIADYGVGPEVIGRCHYDVFPDLPQRWKEIHQRCLAGAIERAVEDPFPREDGTTDWVDWQIHPWRTRAGDIGGLMLFSEVVTERRTAVDRLIATERRYRDLVRMSPVAVLVNRAGRVDYANPAALELFGAARVEELVGRPTLDLFAPEFHDVIRERMASLRAGRPVAPLREKIVRLDGERRDVDVTAAPFDDPHGEALQVVLRDVTEEVRLQQALFEAQKMESIGRLAGGVAHDFNNLLTVILCCAAELRDGLSGAHPQLLDDAREIEEAGGRARELTRQLLAFARRQVIAPVALDVNAVVTDSERLLRRIIGEHVDLEVAPAPDLWVARCDPRQLEQVVLNLAVNARDAMPGGGRVVISTSNYVPASADRDLFPGMVPGEYVRLSVRDSGHGIPADVKSRIFEPFFTTKDAGRGTGLGLATVYGIVKQSGGYIAVETEVGRGTVFHVCFPRAPGAARSGGDSDLPQIRTGSETVLLVEDNPAVRDIARRTLQAAGYRVLAARDAAEAGEAYERDRGAVRLLVSDVVMPGLGGPELAQRLCSRDPELRVLFMSGYAANAEGGPATLDPAAAFLPKPFTPAALLDKVRAALDAPSPSPAAGASRSG